MSVLQASMETIRKAGSSAVMQHVDQNKAGRCIKKMASGRYVDLLDFQREDVDLGDITVSLNMMPRFNGHYDRSPPLSVARHSMLVEHLVCEQPEYHAMHESLKSQARRAAIVHDAPETYYGDIQTGIKSLMGEAYFEFTGPIDRAVEWVCGVSRVSEEVWSIVKRADTISLDIERASMWNDPNDNPQFWPTPTAQLTTQEKRDLFEFFSKDMPYPDFRELLA